MTEKQLHSQYLQETMTLKIYQPEAFSPLYKYQFCIMQDGNDYYQMGRAATWCDELQEQGAITGTILVGIHYSDKWDRREKYHPQGQQSRAYRKFLALEVVPYLDDSFPSLYMAHARTLAGDSLGGSQALMTALTYPHTFGKVIMQSPYVDQSVLDAVKTAKAISSIAVYHSIGTEETAVETTDGDIKDFLTSNRELHNLLQTSHVDNTYHELENGRHTWGYWQHDLRQAFANILGPI
ncbi:alpha/beta hydrolase-fold protein [Barrientosiimonas marina]|uniref:Alpha/beta hydrolase n=1 Tax=Lentibacillus kimchii TaxID=1542911 RepID=A0ABW2UT66_9BACI